MSDHASPPFCLPAAARRRRSVAVFCSAGPRRHPERECCPTAIQRCKSHRSRYLGLDSLGYWGHVSGPNVQESGGNGISDLTDLTNGSPLRGLGQFDSYGESTFDWSNGTPTSSDTDAFTGLQNDGTGLVNGTNVGEGFSFSVPADLMTQEI